MKRAKRTQVPQLAEAPPQSHLQRRRSLGNRCIRATQRKNGKNGGRHKTSQFRRTYKQKWKSNEELEAQRRRPGKRERETLRQQGPAVPSPRETPKWPPPQPPSPRRAVKREQITQSENPPGEVSANVARSSQSENPPGEVADSGARSSQSENPQGEVPGQAKEEKPKAEEEPQPAQAKAPKVPRGQILSLV